MTTKKRQLTVKGAFKRKAAMERTEPDEECDQLEQEVEELKRQLAQKQAELIDVEKETMKNTLQAKPLKVKTSKDPKLVEHEAQKRELEERCWRQKLVLGLEVVEYEEDFFTIVYNTQHDSHRPTEYGLRIEIENDTPAVSKYSLPIGFNLSAVLGQYETIKHPEALCAVWSALVAFHTRQRHYELLTKLLPYEVRTFTVLDTSHVELRMQIFRPDCPDRAVDLALDLDYNVSDVFASKIDITADIAEEEQQALEKQCAVFYKKPLDEAFQICFMKERGPWQCYTAEYEMEEEVPPERSMLPQRQQRPPRRTPPLSDNDSWLPDDIEPRRRRT